MAFGSFKKLPKANTTRYGPKSWRVFLHCQNFLTLYLTLYKTIRTFSRAPQWPRTDQCHMTILWAQVFYSSRSHFFEVCHWPGVVVFIYSQAQDIFFPSMVGKFRFTKCDQCDADYVGYTTRHLHQRIEEHKAPVIGLHIKEIHDVTSPDLTKMFSVLKKCQGKLDCLVKKMLLIRDRRPALNTQSDSIRAKVFN